MVAGREDSLALAGSSLRMRMDGVWVSSNWPDFTAQINPARKDRASARLARISMTTTDIGSASVSLREPQAARCPTGGGARE